MRSMRTSLGHWSLLGFTLALVACVDGGREQDRLTLQNSMGKDDGVSVRLQLTESSPMAGLSVRCDNQVGCDGWVELALVAPSPCELLEDPRCGIGGMEPAARSLGTITVTSRVEGERLLPFELKTSDGVYLYSSTSAAFTAEPGEDVEIFIERAASLPPLKIKVSANWTPREDPGAEVSELESFLTGVPGLSYIETSTAYPGYRAYELWFDQPLDHEDPQAGALTQRMVLHHKDRGAPMTLYTSGYELSFNDYLAELSDAMGANQLSTEQRFFGTSAPEPLSPEDWRFVNIRQAAADHHRIVAALKPFYQGPWISTGHSKGGMTSLFHRRFYPEDVDATVAYVAPISFSIKDPRYIPFLDAIGDEGCRARVRDLQSAALADFDTLQPMLEEATYDATFDRAGGHAAALEKSIISYEWSFWQSSGLAACDALPSPELSSEELAQWVSLNMGVGWADHDVDFMQAYYYQALTELGLQAFATGHLEGQLRYADQRYDYAPAGTAPEHQPDAMVDIQKWVQEEGQRILFLYGEYDPWTGGAYDVGERPDHVSRFDVPRATHAAVLRGLDSSPRERALDLLEGWIGHRPAIQQQWTPQHAPVPPGLLHNAPRP